ncbi:unnamed protein product, partial [Adineta ricciae]
FELTFTDYYTSILGLCHKHDPEITDLQVLDWLKAGMSLSLYERLQGEEFTTPQALLRRAQRVELDNAVLDARKRESATKTPRTQTSYTTPRSSVWLPNTFTSPPPFVPPPAPPLVSTPVPTSYDFPPPSASSTFYSPNTDSATSTRSRRPIICFACNQPGHVSTQCPSRPIICFTCNQPGHVSTQCPSRPIICFTCNQPGHISPQCPTRPNI